MRREGYYGLLLALLAFVVLYLLNKAGLLHLGASSSTGTTTATVSATVGGVPVGSATTVYSNGVDPVVSAINSTRGATISEHRLLGSNLF